MIPGGELVELLPRCSEILDLQLELAESYQMLAESFETDSNLGLHIMTVKITNRI